MGCLISEKAVLRILVLVLMGLHMVRLEVETMMHMTDNVLDSMTNVGMGITSAVGNWTFKELQQEIVLRTGQKDEQIERFIREENAILAAEDRRSALLASQRMKQADFQSKRVPAHMRAKLEGQKPAANVATKPLEAENVQATVAGIPRTPPPKKDNESAKSKVAAPRTPPANKNNAPALRASANLAPRLELLHNHRTAGGYLSILAMKKGISWGACHFNFPWRKFGNPWKDCPDLKDDSAVSKITFWNYPLQRIRDLDLKVFPYNNMPDAQYVKRPAKYFVVVRNPYDRMLSLYLARGRGQGNVDKEALNGWIQNLFEDPGDIAPCQYQYLLDKRTGEAVPDVDHMVQFEYLREDFNSLMEEYKMDIEIPEDYEQDKYNYNGKAYSRSGLKVDDFDDKTLEIINTVCELDFKLGRGYKMIKPGKTTQVRQTL